uniref:EF-hand domain-containing protein n=1 Tax=Guillardia theta TaxID=55529 RepID=A0A7S4H960_GUITH|mmetsp:Transcript_11192/g.38105  ORF Transcript_11192/g.38105 Transcript_11192/m.38105 type:complete len:367 (+) Transcript_11192:32-1132(+)
MSHRMFLEGSLGAEAGRLNVTTGVAPSTHGFGAYRPQASSKNAVRPLVGEPMHRKGSSHFNRPSERTTGGNSYTGGYKPEGNLYPERVRAVRSAGYGQGKLAVSNMNHYRPSAPFHTGTPANLQRPQFDNWSAKKKSSLGLFGTSSSVVYWGDLKERDEKMKAMRLKYDMNESRRELVREAFHKLDHDGDGLVTIDDLRNKGYNAKSHPRYSAEGVNHWSEDQIYLSVLARFKGGVYEPGTTVKYQDLRLEEFEEYYRIVGEDLDDEYFEAMMIQAWRIQRKNPGFQGYDNRILSQLALVEANMLQDKYFGQDELNRSKLEAVQIDSEQQAKLDSWKSMIQSGDFNKMNKAAEEIEVETVSSALES